MHIACNIYTIVCLLRLQSSADLGVDELARTDMCAEANKHNIISYVYRSRTLNRGYDGAFTSIEKKGFSKKTKKNHLIVLIRSLLRSIYIYITVPYRLTRTAQFCIVGLHRAVYYTIILCIPTTKTPPDVDRDFRRRRTCALLTR